MFDLRFVRSDRLTITPELTLHGLRWRVSAELHADQPVPYLVGRLADGTLTRQPLELVTDETL